MERTTSVYPGTFDPITNGHIDLIERALRLFDRIVIAVAPSAEKSPSFSLDERMGLIRQVFGSNTRVEVDIIEGLLVDYVRKKGAIAVIRGLRAVSDFEYEFQLALMNRKMDPDFETVFLMPSVQYTYLSSSIIKEVAKFGGNLADTVPEPVREALKNKLEQ